MVKSILIRVAIVLIGIVVVMVGRGFYLYSGSYSPPPTEVPAYQDIIVPPAPLAEFSSEEVVTAKEMTVLIDLAHSNNFEVKELNVLMLQLISRGLTIKLFDVEDDLKTELVGEEGENDLEEKSGEEEEKKADEEKKKPLPRVFIIVSPTEEFSKGEKEAIHEFLDDGGRLLLIADPTRPDKMNNLSLEFGLIFEPGYLYNMTEYETNYRNIFVTEFEDNEITRHLSKLVFYTAGSISAADGGIAFVDQNTFSSQIESRTRLSPMAMAKESNVLAIYDLTFMTEPYNGILDNNQLIANITNWLVPPNS